MADWTSPIRLAYATAQSVPAGGMTVQRTRITARVENLAFQKQVMLHFSTGTGWQTRELEWAENRGDHDIFFTGINGIPMVVSEFALSYRVLGREFWDSRLGVNYRLGDLRTTVGGGVSLQLASTRVVGSLGEKAVDFEVYVRNTSPDKAVGIRYSFDSSGAWVDQLATFAGTDTESTVVNLGEVERWTGRVGAVPPLGSLLRFAVFTHDRRTQETLWDSNFGHNYVVGLQAGAVVR